METQRKSRSKSKRVLQEQVQPAPKRKRGPYKTWVANGNIPPKTLWSRETRESLVCPNASKASPARVTRSRTDLSRQHLQSIENITSQMGVSPESTESRPCNRILTPDTNVDMPHQSSTSHGERNDQVVHPTDGELNESHALTTFLLDSARERVEESCNDMNDEVDQNILDEEDFILRLDGDIEDDQQGGTEKEEEEEKEADSTQDIISSESETDEESLAEAEDLHLSIDHRIKLLLLMATKRRHKLTYSCAEDIMELSGVLSKENEPFLPARHMIKKTIEKFSFSLTEHHICPNCNKYVGIVTGDNFNCNACFKDVNSQANKKNGNFFLYLSLRDQLKALLETTLSQDDFIDPKSRDKMCKYNYEDIFDGSLYTFNPGQISFNFFVDGVQVATTCKKSAWPVLVTINELPLHLRRKYVLMVSLWLSKKKPDCNEYLKPFVQECNELIRDGIVAKKLGVVTTVRVKPCCCISDSIARPLLRNSSQFNGKFGCGFCYHPGVKMRKGRGFVRSYTLREGSYPSRTHEELMADANRAEQLGTRQRGIKGISVLCDLPDFDMVNSIDLDLFHALVNVAKRFASLWFDKAYSSEPYNIRAKLSEVDGRLLSITPTSDVSRAPRSLEEKSDYRGHEWYFWVAAYSVPCLKNLLPQKYLNHWAHLVYGITLIMQNSVSKCDVAYSERHINLFISGIDDLYGSHNVTFSIHLLSHLSKSVKNFAQPWSHSAFIFESFNNEIKNCVKSSNGAALQICKEMQMKVALKKLEYDVYDYMSAAQKSYLKKMSESSKQLAAPHQSIGSASFFGMPRVQSLPPASVTAIVRSGGKCDVNSLVSVYDRCSVGGVLYQSVNYTKVTKQNNSLALLKGNEVFLVDSFVVISSQCYVVGYFYELTRNQKLCDVLLPHYLVLKSNHEGTIRCVGINELLSKLLLINVQISSTEILKIAYINVLQMEMLN